MEEKKLKQLENFINEKIPETERKRVILVIEGKTLSWEDVLRELKSNGDLSSEIEKKLGERIK